MEVNKHKKEDDTLMGQVAAGANKVRLSQPLS